MFDNHLHTTYSRDSVARPADIVAAGKARGLSGVVFTDHWDVGYEGINTDNIVPSEYSRGELRDMRSLTGFGVLCGIELSPMPHVLDRVRTEMGAASFDFIILAAHYAENIPHMRIGEFFRAYKKKDAYDRYLMTLLKLIEACGDFDTLGHFDYLARYAPYDDPSMRYREHAELLDELFMTLIRQEKTLELNTATYRRLGPAFPFDKDILRRYRELGGELVCLGSDAHRTSDVGAGFGEFRDILKSCGFHAVVHYEERKPVFDKI